MTAFQFFSTINSFFAVPSTLLFFGVAVYLTWQTRFIQIRAFPYFLWLITGGIKSHEAAPSENIKTISSFHALFTAMATTIGMGNVVGPSIAIITGGPGALFWLLVYMFFGCVTKFVEVTYALDTRLKMKDGFILGGPMQYLKTVSPALSMWYSVIMVFLFTGWSSLQSNTLANIMYLEDIPHWLTGALLALFTFITLLGGAKRVGNLMSKLVPIMFIFYVLFALSILFKDPGFLWRAFLSIFTYAFTPMAPVAGFLGATIFQAMSAGIYKGIYISEAGVGTSSIPHAISDTEKPTDQGILAMGSMLADATLSLISGLLIIVTGIWATGSFRSTLIYEVFKGDSQAFGQTVLIISLVLFVTTTVIGNSFNGTRCFAWLTQHRWDMIYLTFTVITIFVGSLLSMPLMWQIMDTLLVLVAVPNLIGLLILVHKKPHVIRFK